VNDETVHAIFENCYEIGMIKEPGIMAFEDDEGETVVEYEFESDETILKAYLDMSELLADAPFSIYKPSGNPEIDGSSVLERYTEDTMLGFFKLLDLLPDFMGDDGPEASVFCGEYDVDNITASMLIPSLFVKIEENATLSISVVEQPEEEPELIGFSLYEIDANSSCILLTGMDESNLLFGYAVIDDVTGEIDHIEEILSFMGEIEIISEYPSIVDINFMFDID